MRGKNAQSEAPLAGKALCYGACALIVLWNKPYHPPKNQRLDPALYTHSNRVYFMTLRTYRNKSPFVRPELNKLTLDILREEQDRQNFNVYTFCLMPDHFTFSLARERTDYPR